MRKCNNCNKEYDESVDFCPTCGARLSTQEAVAEPQNDDTYANTQTFTPPVVTVAPTNTANNEPVTIGEWMIMLVNLIPCVGPLIYFIIMLVWAFGDNIKVSKKTFAKANLIIWLVSVGLGVIVFLIMMIAGVGFASLGNAFDTIY